MSLLLKKMREQRMVWVTLDDTHSLRVLPPTDLQLATMGQDGYLIDPYKLGESVKAWKGFSEADFIGAAGSSDPLPEVDSEAISELLQNNIAWIHAIYDAVREDISKRRDAKELAAKNLLPS